MKQVATVPLGVSCARPGVRKHPLPACTTQKEEYSGPHADQLNRIHPKLVRPCPNALHVQAAPPTYFVYKHVHVISTISNFVAILLVCACELNAPVITMTSMCSVYTAYGNVLMAYG